MTIGAVDRRTFNQILAMSAAAPAVAAVPLWAQAKKRSVIIDHTGITWPARVGGLVVVRRESARPQPHPLPRQLLAALCRPAPVHRRRHLPRQRLEALCQPPRALRLQHQETGAAAAVHPSGGQMPHTPREAAQIAREFLVKNGVTMKA